jgi:glutaminyl-tRNA synthetase
LESACTNTAAAAAAAAVAAAAATMQVRLYDVLFKSESPEALGDEWLGDLNPDSLQIIKGARIPPYLAQTAKVRE